MAEKTIFPEPQEICWKDAFVTLGDAQGVLAITAPEDMGTIAASAVTKITESVEKAGGRVAGGDGTIQLVIDADATSFALANSDQAYLLEIAHGMAVITASTEQGLLWGAITLAQLIEGRNGTVGASASTVHDWPDRKWRGLFAESRWGQDLMSLQDWKDAIDYLAAMKYNVLTVGVYNCWPIQYDGQVSEWMMLNLESHPELKSPQHIEYYSAKDRQNRILNYLPRMAEEDFFGELVAYGSSLGVMIRPHFNTPGHNSLIPRMIPEISALDENGEPTGYGFCLSNPQTYDVMYEIIDEICQKYLLPNGATSYHIAADEVYPLVGMHPDHPYKRLSPWCQCEKCRAHTDAEMYVKYITAVVKRLKENGIVDIGMWHDQLTRGGSMNEELAANFADAGVTENIILNWWKYSGFYETTMPELGFRRWVTPMTGYFYQMGYRGHLDNIFLATRLGHEENAEGVESYGVFDPMYHRHFAAMSDWSWNHEGGGEIEDFLKKYALSLFGDDWKNGIEGMRVFGGVVDSPTSAFLYSTLFRYRYDYGQSREQATSRDNYPRPQIERMAAEPMHMGDSVLFNLMLQADRAIGIFNSVSWLDESLKNIYISEANRLKVMVSSYRTAASIVRAFRRLESGAGPEEIEQAISVMAASDDALSAEIAVMDELFELMETTRTPYQVPHVLREMTFLRSFLLDLRDQLAQVREQAKIGQVTCIPELEVLKVYSVPWVG